jgi:hypothetical protein
MTSKGINQQALNVKYNFNTVVGGVRARDTGLVSQIVRGSLCLSYLMRDKLMDHMEGVGIELLTAWAPIIAIPLPFRHCLLKFCRGYGRFAYQAVFWPLHTVLSRLYRLTTVFETIESSSTIEIVEIQDDKTLYPEDNVAGDERDVKHRIGDVRRAEAPCAAIVDRVVKYTEVEIMQSEEYRQSYCTSMEDFVTYNLVHTGEFYFTRTEKEEPLMFSMNLYRDLCSNIEIMDSFTANVERIKRLSRLDTETNISRFRIDINQNVRSNTTLVATCYASHVFESGPKILREDILNDDMHDSRSMYTGHDLGLVGVEQSDLGVVLNVPSYTDFLGKISSLDMRRRRDLN